MSKVFKGSTKFGKGRGSHRHVVLIDETTGEGVCGVADNHIHEVVVTPEGGVMLAPAMDGHSHLIVDIERTPLTPEEKDEDKIVEDVYAKWRAFRDLERKSLDRAKEAEDMYRGQHWDETEKKRLEEMARACVSINMIEKNVDQITGVQRKERTDIRFTPQEAGDQKVADILNHVTKHLLARCFFAREESKVFEDAVIGGRGLFNIFVDFSKDLRGEIIVEKFPYDGVVFGPHEKEDLSDCECLVKHKWFSKAKIRQLWPEKADDIERDFSEVTNSDVQHSGDDYSFPGNNSRQSVAGDPMIDILKKEYRVLECWEKVYRRATVIFKADEDLYVNVDGWGKADIASALTIPGVSKVEQNVHKMRVTKVAGGVLLSDDMPDLVVDDFFVVPVYAKKRGEEFWGKVEPAKDAQRYVNKNYSLALDVGNKMAAYGWFYDAGTFPGNEKEKFKQNSTSPGFVVEVIDASRPPTKVEGAKFPSELVQLMSLGKDQIADIMNIITNPNGANESGSLFEQRANQKLLGSEFLFDNLSFAKQKIGRILVRLIQKYYTPDRLVRLLRNANTKEEVQVGGQPIASFTDDEIIEMLTTEDIADVDVEVTESQWSPSMRMATFALLRDMQQAGMPIPPEALFEFADMPKETKDKLTQVMQQQMESQNAAEQAKADAEIQKTLIAQGQIPDEVKQKFLSPPTPQAPPTASDQAAGIM